MSNAFNSTVRAVVSNNFDNILDLATVRDTLAISWEQTLTNGDAANKAQVQWHDERTLNAGASESLDLAGALSCAFGVVTFTKIKGIAIRVTTATANYSIQVGGGSDGKGTNAVATLFGAADDVLKIQASGMLLLTAPVDGYAVTAGSGDILRVHNPSAGAVTYQIAIWGTGSVA